MECPLKTDVSSGSFYFPGETHVPLIPARTSQVEFTYGMHAVRLSWNRSHDYHANAPFLPAAVWMNTKLYDETVESFLQTTTITSSSIGDNIQLNAFLAANPRSYASVRILIFDYFSRMPPTATSDQDFELAFYRTGLRVVKLMMHRMLMRYRTAPIAWPYYIFDGLLHCERLSKVVFCTMGWVDPVADANTQALGVMIQH